jgi:4-amino-4-deoxy-L-arabinose transferase-like glycosyltransferase
LLLGLCLALGAAWLIQITGYMDADYYYAMGKVMAGGGGLYEPFLWNYLDSPAGIPHPAFQYWMPLTSFLAAGGQMLFGLNFRAAQMPFLLLTMAIPPLTAFLSYRMHRDSKLAWLSGLLAAFPGFYLPFLVTTDSFAIYAMLGLLLFLIIPNAVDRASGFRWLLVGLLSGIAHLTRADGVLVLIAAILCTCFSIRENWKYIIWLFIGYSAVMLPWGIVNWKISGHFFPVGSGRALWSIHYDDLFTYPAERLDFARWVQTGIGQILLVRISAFWTNIKNLLAANGLVFLGPLMILGARKLRHEASIRFAAIFLILLMALMSFVFPFAGSRGGYFHSSVLLMPMLWVLAPVGLREAISFGVRRRGWRGPQAERVFGITVVLFAALITIGLFEVRVLGEDWRHPKWAADERVYQKVAEWFEQEGIDKTIIAVNNPPGFFHLSGIPAVVIPNGDETTLELVVRQYQVEWVLIDRNRPKDLDGLYENPHQLEWLKVETTFRDAQDEMIYLFRVRFRVGEE